MDLNSLGFDAWFQRKQEEFCKPGFNVARVTRVDRERYLVRNESGEITAELTGKMQFSAESSQDLPCVGDWVTVQIYNAGTLAIIHDRFPRKTFLRRKTPGKKIDYQMIAANIDRALIIQSCDFDFNLRRMERYLVMANEGRIEPIILLSKIDLVSAEDLERMTTNIRQAGITAKIIPFSNTTGIGLDEVQTVLEKRKTVCLLGSSGVGKTTLLNRLLGAEVFETNPVREKDSRGRHTTARRQLTVLENGALLIDTPGLRELGMLGVEESIGDSFSTIGELAESCRFNDCTHTSEDGCAIRAAIEKGELDEGQYGNYIKLKKESDFHRLSYVEKRRKDRKFGRMVKNFKIMKGRKSGV